MERVYAFTDEYGNFGWDLDKSDVSAIYVITAIIVKESDLNTLIQNTEIIRRNYFQTGEIKSSKIGSALKPASAFFADILAIFVSPGTPTPPPVPSNAFIISPMPARHFSKFVFSLR